MKGEETYANEQRPFALPFYWERALGLALHYLFSEVTVFAGALPINCYYSTTPRPKVITRSGLWID